MRNGRAQAFGAGAMTIAALLVASAAVQAQTTTAPGTAAAPATAPAKAPAAAPAPAAAGKRIAALGQGGWYAGDTRAAQDAPNDLVGLKSTDKTLAIKPGSAADDARIASMLRFANEAGGAPEGASTGGALLFSVPDKPKPGSGKITLAKSDPRGLASGPDWQKGFTLKYRWFNKSTPLAVKIVLQTKLYGKGPGQSQHQFKPQRSGDVLADYTLVWEPPGKPGQWAVESADTATGNWKLYRQHGNENLPPVPQHQAKPIDAWAADEKFGPLLFGAGSKVVAVQFGIGSGGFGESWLDWLETPLLEGGQRITFGPAPAAK